MWTLLNLAKPHLKDNFLIFKIDQLVDSATRSILLSLTNAYSSYNLIMMHQLDRIKACVITFRELYSYKLTSFGLKSVGAKYQILVNKIFKDQIGKIIGVYIDDMLVKSKMKMEHVVHLTDTSKH